MPKFVIYKTLELRVEVTASNAQAAYEKQLEMDDRNFTVLECEYSIFDAKNNNISHKVEIT